MKLLGIIGGMSWESTAEYYRIINSLVKQKMGNFHSSKCLIYSVDFEELYSFQREGNEKLLRQSLLEIVNKLTVAKAELILIATNTMHKFYDFLQNHTHVPILHIAEASGQELVRKGLSNPLILGTKITMEEDFYFDYLKKSFNINAIKPGDEDRTMVNRVIFEELVKGEFKDDSRNAFMDVIDKMKKKGADSVMLACTEIPLLIKQEHSSLPVIDTTFIHAAAAVKIQLNEQYKA